MSWLCVKKTIDYETPIFNCRPADHGMFSNLGTRDYRERDGASRRGPICQNTSETGLEWKAVCLDQGSACAAECEVRGQCAKLGV